LLEKLNVIAAGFRFRHNWWQLRFQQLSRPHPERSRTNAPPCCSKSPDLH